MNFREHKNVFVKCVASRNPSNLEWVIEEAGRQYNLIDLQYSTTTNQNGAIEYSALMLLGEKEQNAEQIEHKG